MAEAPETEAGWECWDTVERCQAQLRVLPMGGVAGLDFAACFEVAGALGYDLAALAELLPAAEEGLLAAAAKDGG